MKKTLFYIFLIVVTLSACEKDENVRPNVRPGSRNFSGCETSMPFYEGDQKTAEFRFYLKETLSYYDSIGEDIQIDTTGMHVHLDSVVVDSAGILRLTVYFSDTLYNLVASHQHFRIPKWTYDLTLKVHADKPGYAFEFSQIGTGNEATVSGDDLDLSGIRWPYADTRVKVTGHNGFQHEEKFTKNDFREACPDKPDYDADTIAWGHPLWYWTTTKTATK